MRICCSFRIYFLIVVLNILETLSIQNYRRNTIRFIPYNQPLYDLPRPFQNVAEESVRHFRHISSFGSLNFDWENGLREATTQALIKEGSRDVNLRKHILYAPILGKQIKSTPFGDIAVLARGQLYITPGGYLFNQDPYQNDCEGCHNEYSKNEILPHKHYEQLVALWTVRRIRHRPVREDSLPRFEVEFTISPISPHDGIHGQITEKGQFNYAIPGHVFLMKGDSHQNSLDDQKIPERQSQLIAQSADGRKYILQSFPGFLPSRPSYNTNQPPYQLSSKPQTPRTTRRPTTQLLTDETLSEEEERKIYQTLLEILRKRTSTQQPQRTKPTSKATTIESTQIPESALVQLPDGNLVPITEVSSPYITKTTPGFVNVRFPESTSQTTSQKVPQRTSTSKPAHTKTSTTHHMPAVSYKPQTSVNKHHQASTSPPKATIHIFTPTEEHEDVTPTSKRPEYTTAFSGHQNVLADTTLAQSQTSNIRKQSTTGTTPHQIKFPSTSKDHATSQVPPTKFVASNQIITSQRSTPFTKVPVTTPWQMFTKETTQYSAVAPIVTSQKTVISPTELTHKTEYFSAEIPNMELPTTTFKRPITTAPKYTTQLTSSSRLPTTVFIEPFSQKVSMTTQEKEPFVTSTKLTSESTELLSSPAIPLKTMQYSTTPPPTENLVETTLGVTRVMNTITNDTPGTIFIVSEPSEETQETYPSTLSFNESKETTLQTTNSATENEKYPTPQYIITTIGVDGTVSVKTTPIETTPVQTTLRTTTPRQGLNKKLKTKSTTEKSNFLLDTDLGPSKTPLYKYPSKDYSADDIFGTTSPSATKPTVSKVSRPYKTSDVELALFGKERYTRNYKNRKLKYLGKHSLSNDTEKLKYSSSYASPDFTTSSTEEEKTTFAPLHTSQSVLTSISYQINKRKNRISKNKENIESTTQPMVVTTKGLIKNNKNILNPKDSEFFASKLFSQAKSIEFLYKATTPVASTTVKMPKYMRRSYVRRSKRPGRKKKVNTKV